MRAAVIKNSARTRGSEMVFLQELVVIIQNPAGAGGSEIKQKTEIPKTKKIKKTNPV